MAEADADSVQVPAETVGARLRQARESAGYSRKQLAELTKIPERHLETIEANQFRQLPARTYALGFSRNYARALGLDEAAIVRDVRAELDGAPAEDTRTQAFEPGDPARVPSARFAWIAGAAALLALLASGLSYWRSYYVPAVSLPPIVSDTPAPAPAPNTGSNQPVRVAPQPPSGGAVVLTAQAPVWVRIRDEAGQQLIQKEMAQGESYTVPADAAGPKLDTAHPEVLAVTVGGRALGTLGERQGTVRNVPISAPALLARGSARAAPPATPAAANAR